MEALAPAAAASSRTPRSRESRQSGARYEQRSVEPTALYEVVREHLETFYAAVEDGFASAPLPQFDGNYTVLGSWFAAGAPCGLSVREDMGAITKNTSRFLPHAILG